MSLGCTDNKVLFNFPLGLGCWFDPLFPDAASNWWRCHSEVASWWSECWNCTRWYHAHSNVAVSSLLCSAPSVAHCNTLPLLSISLGLRYIISVLFSAPRRTVVVVVQRCEVCKSHKGLCVSSAVSETEMWPCSTTLTLLHMQPAGHIRDWQHVINLSIQESESSFSAITEISLSHHATHLLLL